MLRRLMLLFGASLIAGCATTYEYYGDERYAEPVDGYVQAPYDDGYDSGYAAGGSYAGGTYGYAGSSYAYDDWYEYPAYYSVFWSLNRWYVDPFWHPHFYYGVTWFPRSYFDVSFRSFPRYAGGFWPPYYRYVPYSPYRGSWVDHYYDWTPWYAYHPHTHHHYAPRYGNVRYEADRLSDWSRHRGSYERWRDEDRRIRRYDEPRALGDVRDRRDSYRGADPGGASSRRIDPQVRGFDAERGAQGRDARSAPGYRQDPGVRGFADPRDRVSSGRVPDPDRQDRRAVSPGADTPRDRGYITERDRAIQSRSAYRTPPGADQTGSLRSGNDKPVYAPRAPVDRSERPQATPRGNDYEVTRVPPGRSGYGSRPSSTPAPDRSVAPSRGYSAPAPSQRGYAPSYREPAVESRSYQRESAAPRSYSAPAPSSYQAPSRSYREPSQSSSRQPQFEMRESRPEPRAEPAPRYERPEVREERDDDDRGGRGRGRSQDE